MKRKDQIQVEKWLKKTEVAKFIKSNYLESFGFIGMDKRCIDYLIQNIDDLNIKDYHKKHTKDLYKAYDVNFMEDLAPKYFQLEVIPNITSCNKILDLGCGNGILAHMLEQSKRFGEILGIEINKYKDWERYKSELVKFKVVKENSFLKTIKNYKPDAVVMTWVLHHMTYPQQKRYLNSIFKNMKSGTEVVILEDTYSEKIKPSKDNSANQKFQKFSKLERHSIIGTNDWVANRVIARRDKVPVPFGYRTIEEWIELFEEVGFKNIYKKYIGIPKRDVFNPQGVLVFKKP